MGQKYTGWIGWHRVQTRVRKSAVCDLSIIKIFVNYMMIHYRVNLILSPWCVHISSTSGITCNPSEDISSFLPFKWRKVLFQNVGSLLTFYLLGSGSLLVSNTIRPAGCHEEEFCASERERPRERPRERKTTKERERLRARQSLDLCWIQAIKTSSFVIFISFYIFDNS